MEQSEQHKRERAELCIVLLFGFGEGVCLAARSARARATGSVGSAFVFGGAVRVLGVTEAAFLALAGLAFGDVGSLILKGP